jgi:hypothetical protein
VGSAYEEWICCSGEVCCVADVLAEPGREGAYVSRVVVWGDMRYLEKISPGTRRKAFKISDARRGA